MLARADRPLEREHLQHIIAHQWAERAEGVDAQIGEVAAAVGSGSNGARDTGATLAALAEPRGQELRKAGGAHARQRFVGAQHQLLVEH